MAARAHLAPGLHRPQSARPFADGQGSHGDRDQTQRHDPSGHDRRAPAKPRGRDLERPKHHMVTVRPSGRDQDGEPVGQFLEIPPPVHEPLAAEHDATERLGRLPHADIPHRRHVPDLDAGALPPVASRAHRDAVGSKRPDRTAPQVFAPQAEKPDGQPGPRPHHKELHADKQPDDAEKTREQENARNRHRQHARSSQT